MAKQNIDFKFEGIGFNGPHLAKMSFPDFKKEVQHNFTGSDGEAKMAQLHEQLTKRWPQPAIPAASGAAAKTVDAGNK